jgi:hypothetical protein
VEVASQPGAGHPRSGTEVVVVGADPGPAAAVVVAAAVAAAAAVVVVWEVVEEGPTSEEVG